MRIPPLCFVVLFLVKKQFNYLISSEFIVIMFIGVFNMLRRYPLWFYSSISALILILLGGCSGVLDFNGNIGGETGNGDSAGDNTASGGTLPAMTSSQNLAADESINFISTVEDQVINSDELIKGSAIIHDGVTGSVESITIPSPETTAVLAAIDGIEQPVRIIAIQFPGGQKVTGRAYISIYSNGSWSIDGDIAFEVVDIDTAITNTKEVPIIYSNTRFDKNGDIESGRIIVKDNGVCGKLISTRKLLGL